MSLQSAITHTLNYARRFGVQLSPEKSADRLLGPHYYHLNRKYTRHLNNRPNPIYLQKYKISQKFANQIKNLFPDILLLALTGSVASLYPAKRDDIDFLIITRADTLWLTRLRLLFFLRRQHLSFRRFNQSKSANLFCFNLWLDESSLTLPISKQNLRNAVDLVLLKPLFDRHHTYRRFLFANPWAKKFVCTPYTNLINKTKSNHFSPLSKGEIKKGICFENCKLKIENSIAFLTQYFYMLPKITTETITLHSAFFHPKRRV